jgi:hypothetical protein
MKNPLFIIFGLPLLVLVAAVIAWASFVWWDRGAPPGFQPPVEEVSLAELNRNHRGVRVQGTAHYALKLVQRQGSETYFLFPLLSPGDTKAREIRAMIRTKSEPSSLYSYEDLVVEGLARPPGTLVPISTQDQISGRGYHFAEGFVLIEAFDDETVP